MRIRSFRIENFRNLRLAECNDVPSFMVLCGGNGCGKTAVLEALIAAKEGAGTYHSFSVDPGVVSADAEHAIIQMKLSFNCRERQFVESRFNRQCPKTEEVTIRINRSGRVERPERSRATHELLSYYSQEAGSPGFFDYIGAYRKAPRSTVSSWNPGHLSDDRQKQTLATPDKKFRYTKEYLTSLKMRDLQRLQTSIRSGTPASHDSLSDIRTFFDSFFAPLRFQDVYIDRQPFAFVVETPRGEIDIDDLSSGEKEVLNTHVRFHQLDPSGAVILFDEADAHLHPDLERRYLEYLKGHTHDEKNQLILTTHSPEMMMAAGSQALYTVLREPPTQGGNQLARVATDDALYETLVEIMGSRGLVSFNQKVVFIEGEHSSTDRALYEALYPPSEFNISFVPAGDSTTVRAVAERVNTLLDQSTGFQQYYSIVDGDIERSERHPVDSSRLFKLPVYHVENFLVKPELIFEVTKAMLGSDCPHESPEDVEEELKELLFSQQHTKPLAGAILDARIARIAKEVSDAVFQSSVNELDIAPIEFATAETDARRRMEEAVEADTWQEECKGRALLKAYCGAHKLKYLHFRNMLIDRLESPPEGLKSIIHRILTD